MKRPHIYLIAGEPSGDRLGARLIDALRRKTKGQFKISGIGGPEMEKQGLHSHFPMSELTVMGLVEVLPRLPKLLKRIRSTVKHILANNPDVVVTIDSPDFSLRIIKHLQGKNIPLIHYVAPSVWAWKPGRAKKLANLVDHLLTLLPFEPPYFEREGLLSSFIGHSVIESGADRGDGVAFRERHNISPDSQVLCLLPGSRLSEVKRLLPILGEVVVRLNNSSLRLVLPTVDNVSDKVQQEIASWRYKPTIISSDKEKFAAFAASDAAIAASGTVSLELALAKVPHVTVYKINPLTALISRRMIVTPFYNIINILLGREAVPELIQENCKSNMIAPYILGYLASDDAPKAQIKSFKDAVAQLQNGHDNPSDKAASVVLDLIHS
jgi:lipid-A-disaccharide synthase